MAGLDPADAWDRTPGELLEYIEAYRARMERQAYMCFNLAQAIACMVLSADKPKPWDAFPGWIKPQAQVMSDEAIYAAVLAWCGQGGEEGSQ